MPKYGSQLIDEFFTDSDNEAINEEFRSRVSLSSRSIKRYQQKDNDLIIEFDSIDEYSNRAIVRNGVRVGHITLSEPHTVKIQNGSFICKNFSGLKVNYPNQKGYQSVDIFIKKTFFGKNLKVRIDNNNLNISFKCTSIMPLLIYNETIYCE